MGERLKLVADTHKQSHMGSKMLFKMLWEDGFFWDLMWSDCEKEVAKCHPCQVFNVGQWVPTDVNDCGEVAMGPYCNGPDQIVEVL